MLHPVKPYYTNLNHLKPIQGFNQELKKFLTPHSGSHGVLLFSPSCIRDCCAIHHHRKKPKGLHCCQKTRCNARFGSPKQEMGVFGKFRKRMNRNGDENCLANTVIYKSQELLTISSLNPYFYNFLKSLK